VPTAAGARPDRVHGSPGLTAAGAVVLGFAGSLVAALVDGFTGGGLGWLFGLGFALSSGYAAAQVRRADLAVAAIAPPLVFVVLLGAHALVGDGGSLKIKLGSVLLDLIQLAPKLWLGASVALVICVYRWWVDRR